MNESFVSYTYFLTNHRTSFLRWSPFAPIFFSPKLRTHRCRDNGYEVAVLVLLLLCYAIETVMLLMEPWDGWLFFFWVVLRQHEKCSMGLFQNTLPSRVCKLRNANWRWCVPLGVFPRSTNGEADLSILGKFNDVVGFFQFFCEPGGRQLVIFDAIFISKGFYTSIVFCQILSNRSKDLCSILNLYFPRLDLCKKGFSSNFHGYIVFYNVVIPKYIECGI